MGLERFYWSRSIMLDQRDFAAIGVSCQHREIYLVLTNVTSIEGCHWSRSIMLE